MKRCFRSIGKLAFFLMVILGGQVCSAPLHANDTLSIEKFEVEKKVDQLLLLMQKRLVIMHEVARAKWNQKLPIEDKGREQHILTQLIEQAKTYSLDEKWIHAFFQAQFDAAKEIQKNDFSLWNEQGMQKFEHALSLKDELRGYIDQINQEMIELLSQIGKEVDSQLILEHPLSNRVSDYIESSVWQLSIAPFFLNHNFLGTNDKTGLLFMTSNPALKRFKVDKLVRDKIPELMRNKGIAVHERNMERQEFFFRLKEKLIEEAKEVEKAKTQEDVTEELADVLEVVYALAQEKGISLEEVENCRLHKRTLKGGFDKRIYNSFIDIEENNSAIEYYLSKQAEYPEIHHNHTSCIFCQIAKQERKGDVITQFKHCFVLKDQFPVSNGHILIIPHEHTLNWFTASDEIRLDIMHTLNMMKTQLDKEYQPDGYNIGANCGVFAGQTVMHLHVHLIPRYKGDMEDPKGGVRGVIPSKQKY
jgi:chorismate mutase-like protein